MIRGNNNSSIRDVFEKWAVREILSSVSDIEENRKIRMAD